MTVHYTLFAGADTKIWDNWKGRNECIFGVQTIVSRNCNRSGLALIVYPTTQMLEGPEQYQLFSSGLQIMTGSWVSPGALPFCVSIPGCLYLSQTSCSGGLRGAAWIAQYFWQPWISKVRTVVNWESPCCMLLVEMFCCCDTTLPFFLILAESALKATLDQTVFSQKPSSWAQRMLLRLVTSGDGTKLALQLCEQLLCLLCLIFLCMLCELLIKLSKLFSYREATCLA